MAITYEVDETAGLVREQWKGVISMEAMVVHWKQKLADPQVMRCRRTLVDVRESRFLFKGTELQRLVESILEPRLAGAGLRSAMLVKEPVQYGVANQFCAFFSRIGAVEIFQDEDEARAWIMGTVDLP